jgi:hypothetical protein
MIEAMLPLSLPGWKLRSVECALAPAQYSNDASHTELAGENIRMSFEKIDVVDALIYERRLSFAEMTKLVRAEIETALKNAASKLDPAKPLVIFGDHGFRLAPDGQTFSHGGTSTLERITPVFILHPSA